MPGSTLPRDGRHSSSLPSPPHHPGFSTVNISALLLVLRGLNSSCSGTGCFSPGSNLQIDRDCTGPLHTRPQVSAHLPHRLCTHRA